MSKEQEDTGFRVTDKRSFRTDGEPRETESAASQSPFADKPQSAADSPSANEPPLGELPRIDFPSYILSYYTQGLVLLGEVPNPMTNQKEEDLQGARHTIDIIDMLREKTQGNLSKEEDQLLGSVLYELRMKFMARTNRIKL
jgi:hypothetical protein